MRARRASGHPEERNDEGSPPGRFELCFRESGLELRALHHPRYGAIRADWTSADLARRIAGGKRQLLARAVGLHKQSGLQVLDATGGLGRDAFTLASLGAHVTLAERNPIVLQLVEDAQRRALRDPHHAAAAGRVLIAPGDARTLFDQDWPVIYLDPMYPDRGKVALAGKELQLLGELAGADADADGLLAPARACAARVVVKRALKAPPLASEPPAFVLRGTQARFDVYLGRNRCSP